MPRSAHEELQKIINGPEAAALVDTLRRTGWLTLADAVEVEMKRQDGAR